MTQIERAHDRRLERLAGFGQGVDGRPGGRWQNSLLDQSMLGESLQARGEQVPSDAREPPCQIPETQRPQEQIADDEHRPALADQVQTSGERTGLIVATPFATVLNDHLEGRDYLVGDPLTLADFSVGAALTYVAPAQIDLTPYPSIIAWNDRLNGIEAWANSAPKPG